jgi:hypothetical protein
MRATSAQPRDGLRGPDDGEPAPLRREGIAGSRSSRLELCDLSAGVCASGGVRDGLPAERGELAQVGELLGGGLHLGLRVVGIGHTRATARDACERTRQVWPRQGLARRATRSANLVRRIAGSRASLKGVPDPNHPDGSRDHNGRVAQVRLPGSAAQLVGRRADAFGALGRDLLDRDIEVTGDQVVLDVVELGELGVGHQRDARELVGAAFGERSGDVP